MKQKRKVKSLISSENGSNAFRTTLLFLLWWILCFWAVSLFTSSIWVEASDENGDLTYEWIDDQVEVIFDLSFAPEGDLWNAVSNMYLTTEWTFYISGDVVNSSHDNNIDGRVYLLWWEKMVVASDNITLMWWRNNNIEESNPNTAILWWEWNTLLVGDDKNAAVLLWWSDNTIWTSQDGNGIIWWNHNVIGNNVVNSYILWWEWNTISAGSKNVIVWWKGVNINTALSDVFVFSDGGGFSPKASNAFYLDVAKGLWLWTAATLWWVKSAGPVSFWDVSGKPCTTDDLWVQWTIDGCLVWCTQAWVNSGNKWELIDHWDICEQTCQNSTDCIVYVEVPEPKPDYTSQCTYWNVDTGHAVQCASNLLQKYKNVFFETSLIDSEAKCPDPNEKEDKCIFRCEPNYHLTGDVTGKWDGTKCYADCVLPWDSTKIYKHNQTVSWYNVKNAYCSNSTWNPHDTCEKHRATLICNNGEWWVTGSNGKAATKNTTYLEWSCTLHQYRCNTWVYNLSQADIQSSTYIKDTLTDWDWANTDRRNSNYGNVKRATRWIYEVCIDYNPVPTAPTTENGKSCTEINPRHYKLVGCQAGYSTWASHPYECREKCSFDGKDHYYVDGRTITGYKEERRTCPEVCRPTSLTCNDWVWSWDFTGYPEDSCDVNPFTCAWYNVPQTTYNRYNWNSIYSGCELLVKNGLFACVWNWMKYKLVGCVWRRHANSLTTPQYCVSDFDSVLCDPDISLREWEEVDSQWVNIEWIWGWNYWYWTLPEKCDPKCKAGYHGEPPNCEQNCGVVTCEGYNLTSESACPEGRVCTSCRKMNSECVPWDVMRKPDRCDTANGWVSNWAGGCEKQTYSCTWEEPGSNTRPSTAAPESNTRWTYVENTNATLAACQWTCASDLYERDGTSMNCKLKTGWGWTWSSFECTWEEPGSNTRPSTAAPESNTRWTYVENTNATLAACQWTCASDLYERDGTSMNCKLKTGWGWTWSSFECIWTVPQNATFVTWSDQWLTSDVTRTLYASASAAAWKKCAYYCPSTTWQNGNKCVEKDNTCLYVQWNPYLCEDDHVTATNTWFANHKYTWKCMDNPCSMCEEWYNLENNECIKRVSVDLYCSKSTDVHESPNIDFVPRGWEMDHSITLTLSQKVPVPVTATVSYDVDNGISGQPRWGTNTTFSANSLTATLSVQSHDDGCHSLWLNPTAWHYILSNWWWDASEVRDWNTIYQFVPKGNGCTDDPYPNDYCQVSDCTHHWRTIPHGSGVRVYLKQNPTCLEECKAWTVTCNNGTKSWDTGYGYFSCSTRTDNPCSGDGWSSTTGLVNATYDTCVDAVWQSCVKKYKPNGCVDGYSLLDVYGALTCVPDLYVSVNVNVGGAFGGQNWADSFGLRLWTGYDRFGPISGPSWLQPCGVIYQNQSYPCEFKIPASRVGERMWFVWSLHDGYGSVILNYNEDLWTLQFGWWSYSVY